MDDKTSDNLKRSSPLEVTEFLNARYMTGFHCIGPECEDNGCYSSWRIFVDETHYHMIKECMDTTDADRSRFKASMKQNKNPGNQEEYAILTFRPDGRCHFLNKEGLCILHRDYGESILGNTCASYPRKYNSIGKRVELTGALSCPEVARQCLLS